MSSEILIYQAEDGQTKIQTRIENETVWLTIDQMSELFQKSRSTINEHILNIFKESELEIYMRERKRRVKLALTGAVVGGFLGSMGGIPGIIVFALVGYWLVWINTYEK